jgi:hypothetical protein
MSLSDLLPELFTVEWKPSDRPEPHIHPWNKDVGEGYSTYTWTKTDKKYYFHKVVSMLV